MTSVIARGWDTGVVTTWGDPNSGNSRHLDVDIIALSKFVIGGGCFGVRGDVEANGSPCGKKAQNATCHERPFGGEVASNGTVGVDIQLHVY